MSSSGVRRYNNTWNPTALSLPRINLCRCFRCCVVSSGGGLDTVLLIKQFSPTTRSFSTLDLLREVREAFFDTLAYSLDCDASREAILFHPSHLDE